MRPVEFSATLVGRTGVASRTGTPRTAPVFVEGVSALSSLGDYRAMAAGLADADPRDLLTRSDQGVFGRVDDRWLPAVSGDARPTRAERMLSAFVEGLVAQLGERLESFDRNRIAVIVGTSAGGIAEAESSRAAGHRFLDHYDFRYQRLGHLARTRPTLQRDGSWPTDRRFSGPAHPRILYAPGAKPFTRA